MNKTNHPSPNHKNYQVHHACPNVICAQATLADSEPEDLTNGP